MSDENYPQIIKSMIGTWLMALILKLSNNEFGGINPNKMFLPEWFDYVL